MPKTKTQPRPTLKELNAAFAQQASARRVRPFLPAGVEVVQGRGYFYFWSEKGADLKPGFDPAGWYTASVPVCRISQCTVGEVVRDYASMIETPRSYPGVA